jgi:hypothetical protein
MITSHQKLAEFRMLNMPNIEAESWEVIPKPHIRLKSLNMPHNFCFDSAQIHRFQPERGF